MNTSNAYNLCLILNLSKVEQIKMLTIANIEIGVFDKKNEQKPIETAITD